MVHRDIKPGTFCSITAAGGLAADSGLVKSLESSATGKTATGVIMGTVDYISPEQGTGPGGGTGGSDLYSIGVLRYRMLSGRFASTGDSPTALIFQHVYEPPRHCEGRERQPQLLAARRRPTAGLSPGDRHATAKKC